MRSKVEVERYHNTARAGNLLPCADQCCGVLGWLTTAIHLEYTALQERAIASKELQPPVS